MATCVCADRGPLNDSDFSVRLIDCGLDKLALDLYDRINRACSRVGYPWIDRVISD